MARCWSDSVPVADGPQVPRPLPQCWREVQCRSTSPGHAARAGGFGAASASAAAGCGAGHRVRGLSMLHGLPVSCSDCPVCLAVARTATASSIPRAAVAVSGIA
jgi:hypothetical protein